jgi:hypothetical protein
MLQVLHCSFVQKLRKLQVLQLFHELFWLYTKGWAAIDSKQTMLKV